MLILMHSGLVPVVVSMENNSLAGKWKRDVAEGRLEVMFLQAQTQPIHIEWIKAHANGQAFQDNLKVFQPVKVKLPQLGLYL